ncbi:MAG: ankyrin repeat domain-containing protein [Hespellia sp.]|nr:ankyrin repeat domain-containing protein [Hespellia sp.]
MALIKCKYCGGDMEIALEQRLGTCNYCGSTMTIPRIDDEQRLAAFNRGNFFRKKGEFDKAALAYERILNEDDTDAEAHWCSALCRYGIDYVEDPNTYEWYPTCHRASYDSFGEDIDYQAALENSDEISRRQYIREAAKIVEVQKGILSISKDEEAYDIFICYKESDEFGNRTKDSVCAQDIYSSLVEGGYKVFFSRITLEDKAGTEYEPYIFAALSSAKVMLVVGTSAENLSSVWVKNEWSRFYSMMKKDRTKKLIPCIKDMDPYDMPDCLIPLQSFDIGKLGFTQDLLHGLSKVIVRKEEANQEEKEKKANHEDKIQLGFMDYDLNKTQSAEKIFRELLQENINHPYAYMGLLLLCTDRNEKNLYFSKLKEYLPKEMPEIEKKIISGNNAVKILGIFAEIKDISRCEYIVAKYPVDVNNITLVESLVQCNDVTGTKRLVNCGMDSSKALIKAVEADASKEMVEMLLKNGADVNAVSAKRQSKERYYTTTALSSAVQHNNREIVSLLLENHARIDIARTEGVEKQWEDHVSILSDAASFSNGEIIKMILEKGADANEMVHYHTAKGAATSESILTVCQRHNKVDLERAMRVLLSYGARVDDDRSGATELFWAVLDNNYIAAKVLIEAGANVNYVRHYSEANNHKYEWAPLSVAAYSAHEDIFELLVHSGADIHYARENIRDGRCDRYPLIVDVITGGSERLTQFLINQGLDVNGCLEYYNPEGERWETPIVCYASRAFRETNPPKTRKNIIELLVKNGADLSQCASVRVSNNTSLLGKIVRDRYPILFLAMNCGDIESARYLIQLGLKPARQFLFLDGRKIPLSRCSCWSPDGERTKKELITQSLWV